jgi:hypothetical protein
MGMGTHVVLGQTVVLTPNANNLYNTGYSGTVLDGPNQVDTHYIGLTPGYPTAFQATPLANGWVANPVDSQWITVSNAGGVSGALNCL